MRSTEELKDFLGLSPKDPSRIPKVLEVLRQAWEANPELRLTQLIINAAYLSKDEPCSGLFYTEDNELVERMTIHYLKEGK